MKTKHTKGKWASIAAISSDFGNIRYITADLENSTPIIAEIRHNKDQEQDEALANAKLIAAAPELLEVLNKISAELKNGNYKGNHVNGMVQMAEEIILKATK